MLFRLVGFSSEDKKENSTVLIVLFPVLAGGLLVALTVLAVITKLMKKSYDWKLEGLLSS